MRVLRELSVLILCLTSVALRSLPARRTTKLFFEGDMVRSNQPGQAGPFCVLANQFKRKEAVAWRIRVLDSTGQQMDDKELKSVVVELSDGQKLTTKFGPHPPRGARDRPFLVRAVDCAQPTIRPGRWSTRWLRPTSQGRSQTWEPFKRATDATDHHRWRPGTCEAIGRDRRRAVSRTRRTADHVGTRAVGASFSYPPPARVAAPLASAFGPETTWAEPSGGYVGRLQVTPEHAPSGTPVDDNRRGTAR